MGDEESMSEETAEVADGNRRYRIQTVARMTGLATPLLRAWERRYRLVIPARGASGYREYSDEDVRLLQRARRLMERGYTIGEVARLGREALLAAPTDESLLPSRTVGSDVQFKPLVESFLRAAARGDAAAAEQAVARAIHSTDLTAALKGFVQPALVAVGDAWARRELSPGTEHLATSLLRIPLSTLLHSANTGLGPVFAVCASAPGDDHELGALMVALQLARAGRRAVHLGANLPMADLAHIAQLTRAQLVAVSYVKAVEFKVAEQQLADLRARVPKPVAIAVGGRALEGRAGQLRAMGFRWADDVRTLSETAS